MSKALAHHHTSSKYLVRFSVPSIYVQDAVVVGSVAADIVVAVVYAGFMTS